MARRLTKREKHALREAGTPEEVHDRIKTYTNIVTRLSERRQELVSKYPKEYVAVKDDEVVCHAKTLTELSTDCENIGVSMKDVAIRFLDTEKRIMVL